MVLLKRKNWKERGRERRRESEEELELWQAITRTQSWREDERGMKTSLSWSTHLFCPLVPFTPCIFFLPPSFPYFLSSAPPAHYKNSPIMLQTWAAEQITLAKECADRTSKEAGKDSHWVTKKERRRKTAREMKAYCRLKGSDCRGRKNYMKKEKEQGMGLKRLHLIGKSCNSSDAQSRSRGK